MKKQHTQNITALLQYFLKDTGLATPLNEYRAQQAWFTVTGDAIGRHTRSVEVRGGVMFVRLDSPSLRANLMMGRGALISRINEAVGAQTITSLVLN